jgi:hypothetical protein
MRSGLDFARNENPAGRGLALGHLRCVGGQIVVPTGRGHAGHAPRQLGPLSLGQLCQALLPLLVFCNAALTGLTPALGDFIRHFKGLMRPVQCQSGGGGIAVKQSRAVTASLALQPFNPLGDGGTAGDQ